MKKFCLLLLLSVMPLLAQSKSYFDAPFGAGGGYTPSWLIPDLKGLNKYVGAFGTPELSTSGFYASGGAGFVYIGFLPGLRIGGMGMGGSTKERKTVSGFTREVEYTSNFGGFTMEYTIPLVRKVGVSVGMVLGGGSSALRVSRHKTNVFLWDDVWTELSDGSQKADSYTRSLNHTYFTIVPTLNVDFSVYRFVSLRVGGGYSIAFGDTWKMDNDVEVANVPSDIKSGGLYISTGIFVGFFSY